MRCFRGRLHHTESQRGAILTMQIPTLETRRLVLRPWSPNDAEAWFGILREEGILRYFPDPSPPPRAKADRYIAHHLAHWEEHGYGHWAVVTPSDSRVVGWSGLEYLPELRETEVAYLLSKSVWGHGFASEAAQAAIRFGFEAAGLEAIIGLVHQDNIASISVLEKCGLRLADRIRLWGMDMCRYRIHRAESRAATDAPRGQAGLR
jgi:RimJ/RimL family protein N-acetyltransferase